MSQPMLDDFKFEDAHGNPINDIMAVKKRIEDASKNVTPNYMVGSSEFYRQVTFDNLLGNQKPGTLTHETNSEHTVDDSPNFHSETYVSDSSSIPFSKVVCKVMFRVICESKNISDLKVRDHYEIRVGDILLAKDLGDAWELALPNSSGNYIVSSEFLELCFDDSGVSEIVVKKFVPKVFHRIEVRNGRVYPHSSGDSGVIYSPYVPLITSTSTSNPNGGLLKKSGPFPQDIGKKI